jgi:hypothetical protein
METHRSMKSLLAPALLLAALSTGASAQTVLYSETFNQFASGPLAGQSGWTTGDPQGASIVNSGVPGFGSLSLQVAPTQGASQTAGTLELAGSTTNFTSAFGRFAADVVVANTAYEFELGLEQGGGAWSVRVRFSSNGVISLAKEVAPGLIGYVQTTQTWQPGVKFRLGMEIDTLNKVRIYKDGAQIAAGIPLLGQTATITRFGVLQTWPGAAGAGTLIVDNLVFDSCGPPPSYYCPATPTSNLGLVAQIEYSGSTYLSANAGQITIRDAASQSPGLFLCGPNQGQVPFGNGVLCIGAPRLRLPPVVITTKTNLPFTNGGFAARTLDFNAAPLNQITPGSSWNFQLWFRDQKAGGAGFNLSRAANVTFCP